MSAIRGYPTQQKLNRLPVQFVTVEPVRKEQNGASVVAHQYVFEVGTDAAEAGSSESKIVATAHAAQEGDIVRLTSGAQSGKEIKVSSVSANEIVLAEDLPTQIAVATTFQILRHKYPLVEPTGEVKISGSFSTTEEATAADGGALPAKVKVAGGYDGSAVQVLKTDANGELQIDVLSSALPSGAATESTLSGAASSLTTVAGAVSGSEMQVDVVTSALPTGAATSAAQTDGTQKTQLVDAAGDVADVKLLSSGLLTTDKGLVTNTIIHGETTGGGGGYVDVKVTPSGALTVEADIQSSVLPTGAATETTLSAINGKFSSLGQKAMAGSAPVVIASDQSAIPASQSGTWNINNISGTVSLPTGAATETTVSDINGKLGTLGQKAMTGSAPVVIASDQSAIPASQSGTWNINNVSGTVSLPTGAATETTLSTLNGKVPSQGQALMAASVPVVIASNQSAIAVTASTLTPVDFARLDYTVTSVTTGAYVQIKASLAAAVKEVQIFDSSGQTLFFAVGGAGSEVDRFYIVPGGNDRLPITISAGSRIAIKAVSATANSGEIAVNFLG